MSFLTRSLLVFSILTVITVGSSHAQNNHPGYQVFTVNEGLPQNFILGLVQDSSGFIWIGTKDGLARYDGYGFTIYRKGKDILHTPAFNNITNLYTDHHGYLWIQYDNRTIDCYDPSTGIFDHVSDRHGWESIRPHLINYELLVDHR